MLFYLGLIVTADLRCVLFAFDLLVGLTLLQVVILWWVLVFCCLCLLYVACLGWVVRVILFV